MRCTIAAFSIGLFAAASALANDGPFLSVPAGGIEFKKTDAIAMEKEDLFISEGAVRVAYVYRNTTSSDVKTEVAFPLPIYSLGEFDVSKPRYARFSVKVNGKSIPFRTIDRAVLCEKQPDTPTVPTRAQLKPERDVTDIVLRHNLVVADPEGVWDAVDKLPQESQEELIKAGILIRVESRLLPLWKVKTAYVWEQTFPANAETRIEHEYAPQIGYFCEWHLDPYVADVYARKLNIDDVPQFGTAQFNKQNAALLARYDVDHGVQKWAEKQRAANKRFSFIVVDYILTTAAYWKGPIKDFTLTIEKSEGLTVVTSAISGLKKIDDRRFQLKKSNFTPDKDLSIVFIHAYDKI